MAGFRINHKLRIMETTTKTDAGMRERKISNSSVKSKSPRHPGTVGPNVASLEHPEKCILDQSAQAATQLRN
jgi:hypothetical protein